MWDEEWGDMETEEVNNGVGATGWRGAREEDARALLRHRVGGSGICSHQTLPPRVEAQAWAGLGEEDNGELNWG